MKLGAAFDPGNRRSDVQMRFKCSEQHLDLLRLQREFLYASVVVIAIRDDGRGYLPTASYTTGGTRPLRIPE